MNRFLRYWSVILWETAKIVGFVYAWIVVYRYWPDFIAWHQTLSVAGRLVFDCFLTVCFTYMTVWSIREDKEAKRCSLPGR
jgi:hypothetical protein